ncbi:hypothetical protein LOD99_3779 [Oopsacas minuta]|uniref:Uncharacterized protein n=1 Tax=Oopsacas minuta TaxID=111878 RepID=A0AAV7JXT0_9METZ|nr:hypothetical protein LOD99_3779 [Oopsacas minuta]
MSDKEQKDQSGIHREGIEIQFVKIPSKDGPPFLQLFTICGGVWTRDADLPSTKLKFPANRKVVISTRRLEKSPKDAFYLKSNIAYPSPYRCIGIQIVMTTVNMNIEELDHSDLDKYQLVYEKSRALLPPVAGIRAQLTQSNKSTREYNLTDRQVSKDPHHKIQAFTPITVPLFWYRKAEQIFNSLRDSSGEIDHKELMKRSKVWSLSYLKYHSQNLSTFQPLETTKQRLKMMLKMVLDIVNK